MHFPTSATPRPTLAQAPHKDLLIFEERFRRIRRPHAQPEPCVSSTQRKDIRLSRPLFRTPDTSRVELGGLFRAYSFVPHLPEGFSSKGQLGAE